ncbi:hypothetical protein BH10PLA1_BH10PLA1_01760 [soil metagenome]
MVRTLTWSILAVLEMMLAGCASGPLTEVVVGPDGLAREVTVLQTKFAPKEALKRTAAVFERLELQRVKPPGYTSPDGGGFFSSELKDWPIASDAFSGDVRARTAAGEAIDAYATWQGQGTTSLKITTQLTTPQHAHLVELIETEMTRGVAK